MSENVDDDIFFLCKNFSLFFLIRFSSAHIALEFVMYDREKLFFYSKWEKCEKSVKESREGWKAHLNMWQHRQHSTACRWINAISDATSLILPSTSHNPATFAIYHFEVFFILWKFSHFSICDRNIKLRKMRLFAFLASMVQWLLVENLNFKLHFEFNLKFLKSSNLNWIL